MNLGKNIYNLLKRQSAVYVTGLGTFRRNHSPATFDANRNVYLPPISYIDFDKAANTGYDFVQYIQQLDQIDRQEAEHSVAIGVQELHKRVREDGQAKLDDLGFLVSYGHSFVFKAFDLSGFNYEPVEALVKPAVPLPIVEIPLVAPIIEPEAEPIHTAADEVALQEIPVALVAMEQQPNAADPERTDLLEETEDAPVKSKSTFWFVIIGIFAIGITVAFYFINRASQLLPVEKVAIDTPQRIVPKEVIIPVDTLVRTDSIVSPTVDSIAIKIESAPAEPADHTWQIVIGSHRTLAQAYEQAESYNKAGYASVRVIPSNLAKNRKKVIWDSYKTKKELDSALMYVQKRVIKDAWPDKIK